MNLLDNRSDHSRLRAFSSLALGSCLLLGTCVLSANIGLKPVNAQSPNQTNSAPTGWFLAGSKPANYQTGVDKSMIQNGQPSAYLKSIVPVTDGFGTLMQEISASDYIGKRVRLRARVSSQDVGDWAGVWMRVDKDKTMVAFDNMQNRAIKGTMPWKQCDVVLDVPEDASGIFFGILLSGSGEVWMSDVSFRGRRKGNPGYKPTSATGAETTCTSHKPEIHRVAPEGEGALCCAVRPRFEMLSNHPLLFRNE